MSAAVQSHLEFVELGVKSQLLLFDGMDHGFFSDPSIPESTRAYNLITRFFADNLGIKHRNK
jgi:monoterpene epsilon-lactone hydrolase